MEENNQSLIPKEQESKNQNSFYYCDICKQIPSQHLEEDDNLMTVNCKCECGHFTYAFPTFFNLLQNQKRNSCSLCRNPLSFYCSDCKVFLCSECHLKHEKSHINIPSTGFKISTKCEEPNCVKQNKMQFYCKDCCRYICIDCRNLEHRRCRIINFSSFLKEDDLENFLQNLSEKEAEMKEDLEQLEAYLKFLSYLAKEIQKLTDEKRIEYECVKKYFHSLEVAYNSTKNYYNFGAMDNLLNNNITQIYEKKKKSIKEKLEKILSLDQRFNKINEYFKVNLTLNEKPKIKEKKFIKFLEGTSFLSLIEVQSGKLVASTDSSHSIYVIKNKEKSFEIEDSLKGHSGNVYTLFEMKNGLLASGSTDSTIRIWDMDNFMAVTIIKTDLDFGKLKLIQLQNGDLIYGGKFDSLIAFSENKDFELISDLAKNSPIEFNEIYDITELNDNEFAVLYNDAIEFWKEKEDNGYDCNNYIEFGEDFDPVCILKFNKEEGSLFVGCSGEIKQINPVNARIERTISLNINGDITGIIQLSSSRILIGGENKNELFLFDDSFKLIKTISQKDSSGVSILIKAKQGNTFYTVDYDKEKIVEWEY